MKQHKCPYLQNGMFCTHRSSLHLDKTSYKKKVICNINKISYCGLLRDSKCEMITNINSLDKFDSRPIETLEKDIIAGVYDE